MNILTKDVEAKLLERTNEIKGAPENFYALHFVFSRLQEHYKSEYQIKIALNILNDIFKSSEGTIYICKDADIAVLYQGDDRVLLEKSIFQLRYLFVDDPLAYNPDGDENPEFCQVYDLGFQWRHFYQVAKEKVGIKIKKDIEETVASPAAFPTPRAMEAQQQKTLLTPTRLAAIESNLVNADLRLALRRQYVCAAVRNADLRPVFEEVYINIQHLRKLIGTEVDLVSNKWLFKYLTEILDGYVLETISKKTNNFLAGPISINLNVDTIISDKFLRFNSKIDASTKSSIIIEINVADVFTDMQGFKAAKSMANELGYRVCLDGLSVLSFIQMDRESLGFDLAKIQWNADMRSDLNTEENIKLKEAIQRCGSNRIILCRCDSKNAVDYGNALGISLFQGRYTDSILNPDAKIIN